MKNVFLIITMVGILSCKENTTETVDDSEFTVRLNIDQVVVLTGQKKSIPIEIEKLNGYKGEVTLVSGNCDVGYGMLEKSFDNKYSIDFYGRTNVTPKNDEIRFIFASGNTVKQYKVKFNLSYIPGLKELFTYYPDTLFLEEGEITAFTIVPKDSSGNPILKSYFDNNHIFFNYGFAGYINQRFTYREAEGPQTDFTLFIKVASNIPNEINDTQYPLRFSYNIGHISKEIPVKIKYK